MEDGAWERIQENKMAVVEQTWCHVGTPGICTRIEESLPAGDFNER